MDNEIKIILLHESGVGATVLIDVFFGKEFNEYPCPTSSSYSFYGELKHKKNTYKYTLWDTVGKEPYRAINKMFFKDAQIIIIVYSIVDRNSFEEVDFWIKYVRDNIKNDKYIMALVANKSDLFMEQRISEEEGKELAKKNGMEFLTTSAKTDSNHLDNL